MNENSETKNDIIFMDLINKDLDSYVVIRQNLHQHENKKNISCQQKLSTWWQQNQRGNIFNWF